MCTCISRIIVQDSIYDDMRDRLTAAFTSVKTGDACANGTELGPIIDHANQQRLVGIIERAMKETNMVVHGGIGEGDLANGFFITPSMFEIEDVTHDLVQDELFGPIVSLERFSDEADALARANATRFGLAASVYTTDLNRSMRMGRKLKFGTVWMNCHNRLLAEVETVAIARVVLGGSMESKR